MYEEQENGEIDEYVKELEKTLSIFEEAVKTAKREELMDGDFWYQLSDGTLQKF